MKKGVLSWMGVLLLLLLSWRAAEALGAATRPSCTETFRALYALIERGDCFRHLFATLARLFAALFFGLCAGVPAGILLGRRKKLERLFRPSLYLGYTVPKITLFPLAVLFIGLNNTARVVIVGLVVFFQTLIAFRDGMKEIPEEYITALTSLGARRPDRMRYLYIPSLLPRFFTSLRISIAAGFAVVFLTESSATGGWGLGRLVVDSWLRLDYPVMAAGVLVTAVSGSLLYLLLDLIEKRVCSWRFLSAGGK